MKGSQTCPLEKGLGKSYSLLILNAKYHLKWGQEKKGKPTRKKHVDIQCSDTLSRDHNYIRTYIQTVCVNVEIHNCDKHRQAMILKSMQNSMTSLPCFVGNVSIT